MLSAHVGVMMSAAAFGDLPTVTTVGRSVGIFPQNNDFCSKCWCPKMKSILETSWISRKPASINSDPGSHCQPSSWMTWADLWWFRIIYSIMWILISEPSFVSTSAGKGQRYISVMIPTTQISPFHLLLSIVWMKTPSERNLLLRACYFSQLIFSCVVNDNIVSVIKCVCPFQFWLTLCQAHSVPI